MAASPLGPDAQAVTVTVSPTPTVDEVTEIVTVPLAWAVIGANRPNSNRNDNKMPVICFVLFIFHTFLLFKICHGSFYILIFIASYGILPHD